MQPASYICMSPPAHVFGFLLSFDFIVRLGAIFRSLSLSGLSSVDE